MKTKIVLLVGLVCVFSSIAAAQRIAAPEVVVRNLYAAQKRPATDPFFQTKAAHGWISSSRKNWPI